MVAILLATYNSEQRLRILLDSIIWQTYSNWMLFIHDDGSTDNTLSILEEYQSREERICVLKDYSRRRGAMGSFMWLLEKAEADYYMFCDHDDIWLPFKIEQTIQFLLSKEKKGLPICVHTDLAVVDEKYNVIYNSLWKKSKVNPKWGEKLRYLRIANCVTGCTMMFNSIAKEVCFPVADNIPMHDWWVAYKVVENGGILTHLNKSTILYCQHGNNEVGAIVADLSYLYRKMFSLGGVYNNNRHNYKLAKHLSHISVVDYWFTKLLFEIRRL